MVNYESKVKKIQSIRYVICFAAVIPLLIAPAYANSSWVWISEKRPYDILPWAALVTLTVETAAINRYARVNRPVKTAIIVTAANLMSFAAPYIINSGDTLTGDFNKYLNHWPSYIVGILYCILTIAVEYPAVYNVLKKDVEDKRRLRLTIVAVNIITTIVVACFERAFCRGRW